MAETVYSLKPYQRGWVLAEERERRPGDFRGTFRDKPVGLRHFKYDILARNPRARLEVFTPEGELEAIYRR